MPGFGSNAVLGITRQNSFDGSSAPNSFYAVPFARHDFNYTFAELLDDSISGRYDEPDPLTGLQGVEGSVEGPVYPLVIGHFLRGAFGVNTVSVVGSGFTHVFKPQTTTFDGLASLPPYSLYVDQGEVGVNTVYKLTDCFVNGLEFSASAGGWMRFSASFLGKGSDPSTKIVPAAQAATNRAIPWSSVSLSFFGAGDMKWNDIRVSFDNGISAQDRLASSKQHTYYFREGFRKFGRISGTMDCSQDVWTKVKSETEGQVVIYATGVTSISSGVNEFLKIDIPRFRFTAHPIGVPGPGMVTIAVEGRALYSSTSGLIAQVTLQNTLAAY